MSSSQKLKLILIFTSLSVLAILLVIIFLNWKRRARTQNSDDIEKTERCNGDVSQVEDLVTFQGGQELTISDILDAPGEVIGKSNYGTVYKALLQKSNCVRLLRFFRPACSSKAKDFDDVIQLLGCVRHPNLVPLLAFYAGPRGEKLLVFPYFRCGNLAQFIRDGDPEFYTWSNIYRISLGIAKGLDHLHTGFQKPVVHGNLKSKNILLDRNHQSHISDYGLYLLLNPTAAQEMLEASAAEGYKPPELIKMKDAREETDIFSFGIILLELLSGKETINENPVPDDDFYLPTFMRNAVLDGRIADLYHPGIVIGSKRDKQNPAAEECVLKFFQLAMTCCSPSPSFRPSIKQVLWKLEEVGRC